MNLKNKKIYFFLLTVTVFLLFIIFPKIAFNGALTGLKLWALTILPGLFPAAAVSSCIMAFSHRYSEKKGIIYIYITLAGLVCGYPLGAILASEYCRHHKYKDTLCEMLMPFCNVSSPSFIINYIFLQLPQTSGKLKILICIYAPLFLCILGTAFYYMCIHDKSPLPLHISGIPDNRKNQRSCLSMADIIDDAILNTAKNMIKLGGYIVIFSCISAYINVIPFKNDIVPAVICGITEITNGIYIAGKINTDKKLITTFIILINSFGGFSTIMQTMGMINGSGLSIRKYIYGKILCTFITGVFCIVIL